MATARPMPPLPQRPTNLHATPGDNDAFLTWSASPTQPVMYFIYLRDATSFGPWQKLRYPVTATNLFVDYLRYGYRYEFKVTAANVAGESPASDTVSVLIVPAQGAHRCANVTSSWLLESYGKIDPIQRYDMTGTICGTRYEYSFRVDESWNSHGKEMYDGLIYYLLVDCASGQSVWVDWFGYEGAGQAPGTSASRVSYPAITPGRLYYLRVTGAGTIQGVGMVNGRFSSHPPHPRASSRSRPGRRASDPRPDFCVDLGLLWSYGTPRRPRST
jgi:hypothetical protein